jgi:hypothetical protein
VGEGVNRFQPTNGRLTGFLGLGLCVLGVVVFAFTGSTSTRVAGLLGCAFTAVLVWAAMLRPRVAVSGNHLRMHTLFETVMIPLASIDTVVVRRYLLVRSGGNKYICPAISRSLRKTVRAEMKWGGGGNLLAPNLSPADPSGTLQTEVKGEHELDYADFVEQQITTLAGNDRDRLGIEARSEEEYDLGSQVVRRTAWPEVIALVVLGAAFVVALVLR